MKPDFKKHDNELIPVVIQDEATRVVLMLGYMNQEAYNKTVKENRVTFFSRSKNRLWTKGESSGHFLDVKSMHLDCDSDTLLIKVKPSGPTCHTGADTCWNEKNEHSNFLDQLEKIIRDRKSNPNAKSYTTSLFEKGINKIAQKVGEEAVEVIIEAKDNSPELFLNESADLLFHFLVLLQAKGFNLNDVNQVLKSRHK